MTLKERIARAKASRDWNCVSEAVPYAKAMGVSVFEREGELLGKMSYSQEIIGNPRLPAIHGGALGGFMESTAVFELLWAAETVVLPKIINITIEYLRSGKPQDTYARGIITKQGRRVANVRVEAWQEDEQKPIAIAYANFLVMPEE